MKGFRLALCQMHVVRDKKKNIDTASVMVEKAAMERADVAILPEMFNCPYDASLFAQYAEEAGQSETIKSISDKAKELGIYVFGGSIPEYDDGRVYNTCFVFGRDGNIIGSYRKMHLFDIDVKGKIRFMESEILSPGNDITIVDTEYCRAGVGICYDMRFPELARLMVDRGAEVLVFPAAFNMVTGPAHWDLLIRTRALDNQVYVAAVSPARDSSNSYVAYGHSMIADPWGVIVKTAGVGEEIVIADIGTEVIGRVREELPMLKQRRTDLYSLKRR